MSVIKLITAGGSTCSERFSSDVVEKCTGLSVDVNRRSARKCLTDCASFCAAVHHRQLLTVFALSTRYEASDISLVVSSGILPRLMRLCDAAKLSQRLTGQAPLTDVSCILATASMRLLQILAITSRYSV